MSERGALISTAAVAHLSRARAGAVVRVVAPAGSGASEAIQAWASRLSLPVYSADVSGRVDAPLDLLALVTGPATSPLRTLRPQRRPRANGEPLSTALPRESVLVLTSVECLVHPSTLQALDSFLSHAADERIVVLSGSRMPDLEWGRILRARPSVDLGPTHLRVSPDDAVRALGHDPARAPATGAEERRRAFVSRVVEDTDGWWSTVSLGLALVGRLDAAPIAATPLEDTEPYRAVAAYVRDEVVASWPADVRAALLPHALAGSCGPWALGSLGATPGGLGTADLAMVREPDQPTGPLLIAPLAQADLIDRAQHEQRAQVDTLVQHLLDEAQARGDQISRLALALRHRRDQLVVHILIEHWPDILFHDEAGLLAQAMDRVPVDVLAGNVHLLALKAALAAFEGDLAQAWEWMGFADDRRRPDTPTWSPGGLGPRNLLAVACGLVETDDAIAPVGLDLDVPAPWLGLQAVLHGFDLTVRGDILMAMGVLTSAARLATSLPAVEFNRLAVLALAAALGNRTPEQEAVLDQGERLLDTVSGGCVPSVLLVSQLAARDLRRGHRRQAERRLDEAVGYLHRMAPFFRTPRVLALATVIPVAEALARTDTARELREALDHLLDHSQDRGYDPDLLAALRAGRITAYNPRRPATSKGAAVARLSTAEARVLSQLATPKPVPRIAADLRVSVATVRAHVRSLYVKLAVNRRADAVQRAHDLGLLP